MYVLPGRLEGHPWSELPLPHVTGVGLGSEVGSKGKQAIAVAYLSNFGNVQVFTTLSAHVWSVHGELVYTYTASLDYCAPHGWAK